MDLLVLEYEMNISNLINELETYNSLERFMYEATGEFFEDTTPSVSFNNNNNPQGNSNNPGAAPTGGNNPPSGGGNTEPSVTVNNKPAGEAEKSGNNNQGNNNNGSNNGNNNGENKEGIISKIIQAIKNFFKQIGDFFTKKANEGQAAEKMKQIEQGLDEHPEIGKEKIQIPWFNKRDLKQACEDYKNGKIKDEDIDGYFFSDKKTKTVTVNEAYALLKENYDVVKNLDQSSNIMDSMLRTINDPKIANGISRLCSNYGKGRGSILSIIPIILKVGGGIWVAKKVMKHHYWKNEKIRMRYIRAYTNSSEEILKNRLANDILRGVIVRKHINAIASEEIFQKGFEGDTYDKKVTDKHKWNMNYLDQLVKDATGGQFNKDYLLHLAEVREYVKKTKGLHKRGSAFDSAPLTSFKSEQKDNEFWNKMVGRKSFDEMNEKQARRYIKGILKKQNDRKYDPKADLPSPVTFKDNDGNIIVAKTCGDVKDYVDKKYTVALGKYKKNNNSNNNSDSSKDYKKNLIDHKDATHTYEINGKWGTEEDYRAFLDDKDAVFEL